MNYPVWEVPVPPRLGPAPRRCRPGPWRQPRAHGRGPDRVRAASLAPHFSPRSLEVEPQTAAVALFFLVLFLGLTMAGWMVRRLFRSAASQG